MTSVAVIGRHAFPRLQLAHWRWGYALPHWAIRLSKFNRMTLGLSLGLGAVATFLARSLDNGAAPGLLSDYLDVIKAVPELFSAIDYATPSIVYEAPRA